jgi:hypothetical protein
MTSPRCQRLSPGGCGRRRGSARCGICRSHVPAGSTPSTSSASGPDLRQRRVTQAQRRPGQRDALCLGQSTRAASDRRVPRSVSTARPECSPARSRGPADRRSPRARRLAQLASPSASCAARTSRAPCSAPPPPPDQSARPRDARPRGSGSPPARKLWPCLHGSPPSLTRQVSAPRQSQGRHEHDLPANQKAGGPRSYFCTPRAPSTRSKAPAPTEHIRFFFRMHLHDPQRAVVWSTPEKWDSGARVSPETSRGPVCKKLRLLPARVPISMQWLKMPRISPP